MHVEQLLWHPDAGWQAADPAATPSGRPADLIFAFGSTAAFDAKRALPALRELHPTAALAGCSTAGQTLGTHVLEDEASLVATVVRFDDTRVVQRGVGLAGDADDRVDSRDAGRRLAATFDRAGLVHVFVLSDGLKVNGSDLVAGMVEVLGTSVGLSGGLAGDAARFARTLVIDGGEAQIDRVTAIGFYGDKLRVGCAGLGGWRPFGPRRKVTRADGNVLYDLDGQSALDLYKKYLGDDHASRLPGSALMFPLAMGSADDLGASGDGRDADYVVRTVLAVDDASGSMTFAGDVPEGATCRLMRGDYDEVIDGAAVAAERCGELHRGGAEASLALLVSCVGRRLILGQRIEEEVEAVAEAVGPTVRLAGFYSYGEIAPIFREAGRPGSASVLHNQTMTVTTLAEAA